MVLFVVVVLVVVLGNCVYQFWSPGGVIGYCCSVFKVLAEILLILLLMWW